ncbi:MULTISPECIES: heavy-metal-associated domain-containing protein [unclassified Streptomyces]|uniref:heavy-metal-associated domain-containing protein n=1 Tax=unclassified Streptomyces TaxID=2593676 RepID=UPI001BE4EFAE|nr:MULTISPECIES: heavy-metal-associated domain-containing protein [unclassified Streptomyces]MBT2407658.1 heavy-metal-associated domain-containing protein [Streptomyces sp. ISL-21]MBT2454221.1 heavy-metal-associated domain-containing protein [Streptomyces sp. ISL-86]MBT2607948.1 heavy-metal-associated domain-containing protein [Streptomyces sp. ISL-87]
MTAETETQQSAGSCCSSTSSCHDSAADVQTGAVTTVYRVTGMTCGHCEGAVTAELTALPGVSSVKAVAATGEVTVVSAAPLAEDDVRAAVDEAGYELAADQA